MKKKDKFLARVSKRLDLIIMYCVKTYSLSAVFNLSIGDIPACTHGIKIAAL